MRGSELMEYQRQKEILGILVGIQVDGRTGPIEVSIGWEIKGQVFTGIVIKKAPSVVIERLAKEGYSLDVTPWGVRVHGHRTSSIEISHI